MRYATLALAIAAGLAAALPLRAHHAHSHYSSTEEVDLTGVMSELRWMNPHVSFGLDVTDEHGEVTTWTVEGPSVNQLMRDGWARDSMEPGDEITIRCWPLRNGLPGCLMGYVLSINGVALEPSHPGAPGKEYD